MDTLVLLESGKLVDCGSYEEIRVRRPGVIDQEATRFDTESRAEEIEADSPLEHETSQAARLVDGDEVDPEEVNLQRRYGSWAVYAYYSRSAGFWTILLWAFFTLIGAVAASLTSTFPPRFNHYCSEC